MAGRAGLSEMGDSWEEPPVIATNILLKASLDRSHLESGVER